MTATPARRRGRPRAEPKPLTEPVTTHVDLDTYDRLCREALARKRALSKLVRIILKRHVSRNGHGRSEPPKS